MLRVAAIIVLLLMGTGSAFADSFGLGSALNYAVLVEANLHNFALSSDSGITGTVGIGSPINAVQLASGTIHGNLDFSGLAPSGGPNFGGTVTGSVNANFSDITTALSNANAANIALGAEAGTAVTISGNTTINASSGTLDGAGNRVFTVTSGNFNIGNGHTLTINGTAGQTVVINIDNGTSNESINGAIALTGGITANHVLFNFVGTGGQLQGAANDAIANGIFLAPDLKVNLNSVTIDGEVIGGGSISSNNDFSIVSNAFVNGPTTVPEPGTLPMLGIGLLGLAAVGFARRRVNS
jgi:hypothetical protein